MRAAESSTHSHPVAQNTVAHPRRSTRIATNSGDPDHNRHHPLFTDYSSNPYQDYPHNQGSGITDPYSHSGVGVTAYSLENPRRSSRIATNSGDPDSNRHHPLFTDYSSNPTHDYPQGSGIANPYIQTADAAYSNANPRRSARIALTSSDPDHPRQHPLFTDYSLNPSQDYHQNRGIDNPYSHTAYSNANPRRSARIALTSSDPDHPRQHPLFTDYSLNPSQDYHQNRGIDNPYSHTENAAYSNANPRRSARIAMTSSDPDHPRQHPLFTDYSMNRSHDYNQGSDIANPYSQTADAAYSNANPRRSTRIATNSGDPDHNRHHPLFTDYSSNPSPMDSQGSGITNSYSHSVTPNFVMTPRRSERIATNSGDPDHSRHHPLFMQDGDLSREGSVGRKRKYEPKPENVKQTEKYKAERVKNRAAVDKSRMKKKVETAKKARNDAEEKRRHEHEKQLFRSTMKKLLEPQEWHSIVAESGMERLFHPPTSLPLPALGVYSMDPDQWMLYDNMKREVREELQARLLELRRRAGY